MSAVEISDTQLDAALSRRYMAKNVIPHPVPELSELDRAYQRREEERVRAARAAEAAKERARVEAEEAAAAAYAASAPAREAARRELELLGPELEAARARERELAARAVELRRLAA